MQIRMNWWWQRSHYIYWWWRYRLLDHLDCYICAISSPLCPPAHNHHDNGVAKINLQTNKYLPHSLCGGLQIKIKSIAWVFRAYSNHKRIRQTMVRFLRELDVSSYAPRICLRWNLYTHILIFVRTHFHHRSCQLGMRVRTRRMRAGIRSGFWLSRCIAHEESSARRPSYTYSFGWLHIWNGYRLCDVAL